ncbi:type VI secretion system tube protein TssD [Dysgonomonas sp. 25]|uniref:type VI secretion system tube protein TssD n=1 Tax=Dysgonomonas sp. 25 TaxID=2302933 RepID=UPI0013D3DA82|nr:type VI secretion system tube protein TssD [Dysgonomonas sp. 25]NDV69693.1 type VI secretion system needle protein Hcp [Dysgonomonas sp. 25]
MFSHKSFLKIGTVSSAGNIFDLTKNGYELASCNYSFLKNIDNKGQVQSRAAGGIIEINISALPSNELITWALNSRLYLPCEITFCDESGVSLEKLELEDVACISMDISYARSGSSYISTSLVLSAKTITIGSITYESKWVNK